MDELELSSRGLCSIFPFEARVSASISSGRSLAHLTLLADLLLQFAQLAFLLLNHSLVWLNLVWQLLWSIAINSRLRSSALINGLSHFGSRVTYPLVNIWGRCGFKLLLGSLHTSQICCRWLCKAHLRPSHGLEYLWGILGRFSLWCRVRSGDNLNW